MERKEYRKEWYQKNKGKVCQKRKEWYQNNKEYVKIKNREYYEKHRNEKKLDNILKKQDKIKEFLQTFKENHPNHPKMD